MKAVLLIVFICAVIAFGPLLTIWALNTLFGLGIAFTAKTWFAVVILGGLFSASSNK
jgi:hypothetical protein